MKALEKDILRDIKKSGMRFFYITAIIALGVAFFCGIKAVGPSMRKTAVQYYQDQRLADFHLKSTYGFTQADLTSVADTEDVAEVTGGWSMDVVANLLGKKKVVVIYSVPEKNGMDLPLLVEGRLPTAPDECVIESSGSTGSYDAINIGDSIPITEESVSQSILSHLKGRSFKVVGKIRSPIYVSLERGNTNIGSGSVDAYMMVAPEAFDYERYTDAYVLSDYTKNGGDPFADAYTPKMDSLEVALKKKGQALLQANWNDIQKTGAKEIKKAEDELAKAKDTFNTQIAAAQDELDTGQAAYDTGLAEYTSSKKLFQTKIAQGQATLTASQAQLDDGRKQLAAGEAAYKTGTEQYAAGLSTFETQKAEALVSFAQAEEAIKQIDAGVAQIDEGLRQADEKKTEITAGLNQIKAGLAQIDEGLRTLDENMAKAEQALSAVEAALKQDPTNETLLAQKAALEAQLAAMQDKKTQLTAQREDLSAKKEQAEAGLAQIEEAIAPLLQQKQALVQQRTDILAKLESGKAALAAGAAKLSASKTELDAAAQKIDESARALDQGQAQLNAGRAELETQRAAGQAQLDAAEVKLSAAAKELAEGRQTLAEKREEGQRQLDDAQHKIDTAKEDLAKVEFGKWYVDPRSDNPGYTGYGEDATRIDNVGNVFPMFFFLVAALVAFTTMTRMVEEQRSQLGTLAALGYSKKQILKKYLIYSGLTAFIGATVGWLLGVYTLPFMIYSAYSILYQLPALQLVIPWAVTAISYGVAFLCTTGAASVIALGELRSVPAELMRPKAPRPGKRILLERITPVWKRLSFISKVSMRNIFRYKARFLMTVCGIAGCTALILAGFGLHDSIFSIVPVQFGNISIYEQMLIFDKEGPKDEKLAQMQRVTQDSRVESAMLARQSTVTVKSQTGKADAFLVVPASLTDFDKFFKLHPRLDQNQTVQLGNEGAVINEKIADRYHVKIGDTVTVKDGDTSFDVKITGIVENYLQNYIYLSPEAYQKATGHEPFYTITFVNFKDNSQDVSEAFAEDMIAGGDYVSTASTHYMIENSNRTLNSLNAVVVIMIVSAGLLAFVVLYNLTNINIDERVREIATLKVLGFYQKETDNYIFRENIVITFIGILLGLALGVLLTQFIVLTVETDVVMFGRTIKPISYLYAAGITLIFTFIVNFTMIPVIKKVDMVEALKSGE